MDHVVSRRRRSRLGAALHVHIYTSTLLHIHTFTHISYIFYICIFFLHLFLTFFFEILEYCHFYNFFYILHFYTYFDVKMCKSDCQDTNGNRIYTGRARLDSSAAVSLHSAAQERVPPSFIPRITLSAMIT